ncbi:Tfam [Symbiodinium natans]|uniref:Tfam protein n=1 Tax=Symbiodinium natans TaxID=878477 RepID=A0A812J874_9DINO|nr:Tfam [Symbiodinium natans]
MVRRPLLTSLFLALLGAFGSLPFLRFSPGLPRHPRDRGVTAGEAARKGKVASAPSDPPKRPLTSYLRFCKEERAKVMKRLGKSAEVKDITRELGALWRQLSAKAKKPYEDEAKEEFEEYRKQKAAFLDAGGTMPQRRMPQRRQTKPKKDPNKPKRPGSAYNLWVADNYKQVQEKRPDFKATQVIAQLGSDWKKVTPATKKKYEQLKEKKLKEYQKALEKYQASE